MFAAQADVRDSGRLESVLAAAVEELGRLDFVVANAGVAPGFGLPKPAVSAFLDAVDVTLNGVYYTIEAALPHLLEHGDGGAIVITSSAAAFKSIARTFETKDHGIAGYIAAKQGVVGLMRYYATILAEKNIRVNSVHPSGVATPMIENEMMNQYIQDHPSFVTAMKNLLPVPVVEAQDVAEAMIYLCGNSGRYITGVTLPVDAGNRIA